MSMALQAGGEKLVALEEVTAIGLDNWPKFAEAEAVRGDLLKAVPAYRALIPTINKPELKVVAQWRAIEPLDKGGQWVEAVGMFLEVYAASPTDGVWKVRPTQMPATGSKMLAESADKVAAAVKAAKSDEARKNLQGLLLDIYTKAGDTAAAARLAREIATGVAEEVPPAAARTTTSGDQAGLAEVEAAVRGKDYEGAVKKADALLATVTGDTAVQLFAFKAQAQEALGKDEDAAGTWLRITAHYPSSVRAPEALLHAGMLEKKVGHAEEAKTIFREIVGKYPETKEAQAAKSQ